MPESFDLTISPKYIPKWGKWEAFREIMQNVIDRKNELEASAIIFKYIPNQQRIVIGNKFSTLKRSTLVLGETTKAENKDAIGKYGEGYKLALIVFSRMGTRVRIRTLNEVWVPEIIYSKQFETELLSIKIVESKMIDDVLFELNGISPDDFKEYSSKCLFLNPPQNKITTAMGDILLDEYLRGMIFVEGLFICKIDEPNKLRYGYDLKARHIELDRDRHKVASFNLLWTLGCMYNLLDSTYATMIYNLQRESYDDCKYYDTHRSSSKTPLYKAICSLHHDEFLTKYGKFAIPVETEQEAKFIKEKYNNLVPVLLKPVVYKYVTDSKAYQASTKKGVSKEETPYSITKRYINLILAGKNFKEAREKMAKEFLPVTRDWKIR